jgi:hypothetical protein
MNKSAERLKVEADLSEQGSKAITEFMEASIPIMELITTKKQNGSVVLPIEEAFIKAFAKLSLNIIMAMAMDNVGGGK